MKIGLDLNGILVVAMTTERQNSLDFGLELFPVTVATKYKKIVRNSATLRHWSSCTLV